MIGILTAVSDFTTCIKAAVNCDGNASMDYVAIRFAYQVNRV